jgi:hypothetical protein
MRARLGLRRNRYSISPGLYALGSPSAQSPVVVTANYKLTVDSLRYALAGLDLWVLVADTRGVNVWCAAGKGTFSSREVVQMVTESGLPSLISHRRLILPQLAAPGVCAAEVRTGSGFTVHFGPVRVLDLPRYLALDCRADEAMRTVRFDLSERAALIPVELTNLAKPLALVLFILLILSLIGPSAPSLAQVVPRITLGLLATLIGIVTGSLLFPLLLPWLPCRQFWANGLLLGLASTPLILTRPAAAVPLLAATSWSVAVASYQAMTFTGSTPFTSPTGVALEMRRGLPVQLLLTTLAVICWLLAPFTS